MPLIDEPDAGARAVGAANTVHVAEGGRLAGTNTDVHGTREAVAAALLEGRIATVIGAGGAARAAFVFLAGRECRCVRVIARSPEKAANAARECGLDAQVFSFDDAPDAIAEASLLVNATQLGMEGQAPMPGPILGALDRLASDALVFDMVYSPLVTELVDAARQAGLATNDGLVMLVGQAATAFELFFGQAPPRECDGELRELLTS